MTAMTKIVGKVKLALKKRPDVDLADDDAEEKAPGKLVPFGATMLNLACSDTAFGAFKVGRFIQIAGGNHAGKTILAHSCGAEATALEDFKDHEVVKDDVEQADDFDMPKLFGRKYTARVKAPQYAKDGTPINSDTMDEFSDNLYRRLRIKKPKAKKQKLDEDGDVITKKDDDQEDAPKALNPFLYFLDSIDALADDSETDKLYENMELRDKAKEKGKEAKISGDYQMLKQKKMSQLFRTIKRDMRDSDSALIIISQVRDNIGAQKFEEKDKIGGGRAMEFYASLRIRLKMIERIKSDTHEDIEIGCKVQADVFKNKLTGKRRKVTFCIYYDYGIDDIGSMIDFLIENKHWKKAGNKIDASDICDTPMFRGALAEFCRENGLRRRLQKITEKAWLKREEECALNWKPQYE